MVSKEKYLLLHWFATRAPLRALKLSKDKLVGITILV
jgi:hypothetical protein